MATGKAQEDDAEANLKPIPFKICLVGNGSVGKTCIVERYINDNFAIQQNTLSAAFSTKTLTVTPRGYQTTKVKM